MSDLHRSALIGYGRWGQKVASTLVKHDNFKLKYVVTNSKIPENLPIGAKHLTLSGLPNVIADSDIDSVFIVTPPNTHYQISKTFLQAGKHVFVEKPFCTSYENANELLELATSRKRIIQAGQVYSYTSPYMDMARRVKNDSVLHASMEWYKYGTFDYDIMNNLLIHDVYACIRLFGEEPVESEILNWEISKGTNRVDFIEVGLQFSSNRNAYIKINRSSQKKEKFSDWYLSSGQAFRLNNNKLIQNKTSEIVIQTDNREPLSRMIDDFQNRIRENRFISSNELVATGSIRVVEGLINSYPEVIQ